MTKIDPKDIRIGDRVTVSGTVSQTFEDDSVMFKIDGNTYSSGLNKQALNQATITRPVDPDLILARELCSEEFNWAGYLTGNWDNYHVVRIALAAIKAVRKEYQK